jgi:hypothetical protein
MKDIGELKSFLGITIERDREKRTISLSNSAYLQRILKENNIEDCNGVSTSLPLGLHLQSVENPNDIVLHSEYRTLVGCLLYASIPNRLDIAYAIGALARHVYALGVEH